MHWAYLCMGFVLLLPFFAILIWLRCIAAPRAMKHNVNLAAISLLGSLLSCVVATRVAPLVDGHQLWPLVQGATVAFFVFLTIFGIGWLLLNRQAKRSGA